MKRWGLHRLSILCLLVAISGEMATAAPAKKTNDLLSNSGNGSNSRSAELLAQLDAVLELGSRGAAVKDLQAMLTLMGYYSGAVDGAYEQMTLEAVRQFQMDAGLTNDGVVGPLTWRRLLPTPATLSNPQTPDEQAASAAPPESSEPSPPANELIAATAGDLPVLQLDDVGADVSRLQTRLSGLNLYSGPIDGVFGLQTEEAVEQFQRQVGLWVDGVVGPSTWLALLK